MTTERSPLETEEVRLTTGTSDRGVRRSLWDGALLFVAHGTRAILLLALVSIASHVLSVEEFGAFTFLQAFFLWLTVIAEAGLAIAAARLISQHGMAFAGHVLSAFIYTFSRWSVVVILAVAVVAYPVSAVFEMPVETALILCAVPGVGIVWLGAFREILPALGKTRTLALVEVLPPCIAVLGVCLAATIAPTLEGIAVAYTAAFLLVAIVALRYLTTFEAPPASVRARLLSERRSFGQTVYVARLVGTGGFMVDIPILAFFTRDAAVVGQYALLKGLAAPIALVGQAIAVAQFRTLAQSDRLPRGALVVGMLGSLLGAATLAMAGPIFVLTVLPEPYSVITALLPVWAMTAFLQSSYQLPNTHLRARGQGKQLRGLAFVFGGSSVLLHLTLTPAFGLEGASFAALGAVCVWTTGAWWLFLRNRNEPTSQV